MNPSTHALRDAPERAPVLLLTGPTGIGKTELAVALAERLPLEIISADSMQVYRGMPIGTAQPSPQQRRRAAFHLCGDLDPAEHFDVQRFIEMADTAHRGILARGRRPIYVGGTGMYLRALRWGLFEEGGREDQLRLRLEREASRLGPAALHARLARLDPPSAARIDPTDRLRIVRALEVHGVTGRPLSELQNQWRCPRPRFPHVLVVLTARREWLRRRIAERARAMLRAGWAGEVEDLLASGVGPDHHCFKALGYREVALHIQGRLTLEELETLIINRTRQFARRQMVWFRHERPALWLAVDEQERTSLADQLKKLLAKLRVDPIE